MRHDKEEVELRKRLYEIEREKKGKIIEKKEAMLLDILHKLPTSLAKAKLFKGAIGHFPGSLSEQDKRDLIQGHIELGDYHTAVRLLIEEFKEYEQAINLLLESKDFRDIQNAANMIRHYLNDPKKGLDILLESGDIYGAISYARESGDINKALEIAEKYGRFDDACLLAKDLGDKDKEKFYSLVERIARSFEENKNISEIYFNTEIDHGT